MLNIKVRVLSLALGSDGSVSANLVSVPDSPSSCVLSLTMRGVDAASELVIGEEVELVVGGLVPAPVVDAAPAPVEAPAPAPAPVDAPANLAPVDAAPAPDALDETAPDADADDAAPASPQVF